MTKTELDTAVNAQLEQIEKTLVPLPDEVVAKFTTLFPAWTVGVEYETGERDQYDDKLYRCEQAHTSQAGWEPPNVPALWTKIAKLDEIPVWKQPTGAQDAYNKGDEVYYSTESDPIYVSDIDNNVWAPDVYGWSIKE